MTWSSKRRTFTLLLLLFTAAFGVPQARVAVSTFTQVTICAYDRQPAEAQAVAERRPQVFPSARAVKPAHPRDQHGHDSLVRRVSFQRPPPASLPS